MERDAKLKYTESGQKKCDAAKSENVEGVWENAGRKKARHA